MAVVGSNKGNPRILAPRLRVDERAAIASRIENTFFKILDNYFFFDIVIFNTTIISAIK